MSNKLFLSGADEYFTHQLALPHQVVAASDPNWRERYWIYVHDIVSKDLVLSFGFGKYPNRDVMEGFVIVARDRMQRNLRVSRQLLPRLSEVAVGPLSAQIITPLVEIRFRLDDNPSDIAFDLTWHASVSPALEARHFEVNRGRVTHDIARYVQTGRLSGSIDLGGERIVVSTDRWWGVRDHSWGIRPMTAVPGDPPVASVEWNLMAFFPIQFPSFSLHIYLFESQPGRPTHLSASIMRPPGADERDDEIRSVTHDFEWQQNAPIQTLAGGTVNIEFHRGEVLTIELAACTGRAFLSGGGYGTHHGKWFGENFMEHDSYDLSNAEQMRQYNSHSSDHLVEARCNGEVGYGVIEYLVRRGYARYGEIHAKK